MSNWSTKVLELIEGLLGPVDEPARSKAGERLEPPDWEDKQWDEVLDEWADKISEYGLEVPAVLLGESQKPLSFMFGQGVYFMEPYLDSASHFHQALQGENIEVLGALLSDRSRLEQLIQKVEARARED
jgi:hypothetical protein